MAVMSDSVARGGSAVRVGGDGLPTFPPVPRGAASAPSARSLMRLLPSLETAALEIEGEDLRALVICCEREIVDGYAEVRGTVASGPDVLDAIGPVPGARLRLYTLPEPLLRALPLYWRVPTNLNVGQARWMDVGAFVQSLARPGQRGVVCVLADDDLGLVFLDQGRVVGCYTVAGSRSGGLEEVTPLFADPTAVLLARLEEVRAPAAEQFEGSREDEDAPDPTAVAPSPKPSSGPAAPSAIPAGPAALAEDPAAAFFAQRRVATSQLLEAIGRAVREEVGEHSEPVLEVFRRAPQTSEGLLAAATEVEQMRIRLISAETMRVVARRAREILTQA